MKTTTRRHLLKAAAVGGVTATGLSAVLGTERGVAALAAEDQKGQRPGESSEHKHDDRPRTDKRAYVQVSFGQWDADPAAPFDREPINTDTENRTRNIHAMLPFDVEVDAGGAVSFIISGVHQILVYGPGSKLADVQAAWATAGSPVIPIGPGLVDFAEDRVYRGLNPFVLQYLPLPGTPPPDTVGNLVVDRVESVNFKEPGRYLVVCGVRPHFAEGMHGYVKVKG